MIFVFASGVNPSLRRFASVLVHCAIAVGPTKKRQHAFPALYMPCTFKPRLICTTGKPTHGTTENGTEIETSGQSFPLWQRTDLPVATLSRRTHLSFPTDATEGACIGTVDKKVPHGISKGCQEIWSGLCNRFLTPQRVQVDWAMKLSNNTREAKWIRTLKDIRIKITIRCVRR